MRKLKITSIAAAVLLAALPAFALDFIIGAKSGYFVWAPYFREMKGSGVEDVDQGSGVLYGPVVSLLFTPDLSFSVAGLFGNQSTHWTSDNKQKEWMGGPKEVTGTYYFDIKRTDIDSALSWRLSETLKVFAGYKYQDLKTNLRASVQSKNLQTGAPDYLKTSLYHGNVKIELPAHGPALGAGYSYQLGDGYFVSANLSCIYLWSEFNIKKNYWLMYQAQADDIVFIRDESGDVIPKIATEQVGLNFEPSIGVKVGERAIYTLGLRFQWMATRFKDEVVFASQDWMNDYVYGLYVSVLVVL